MQRYSQFSFFFAVVIVYTVTTNPELAKTESLLLEETQG